MNEQQYLQELINGTLRIKNDIVNRLPRDLTKDECTRFLHARNCGYLILEGDKDSNRNSTLSWFWGKWCDIKQIPDIVIHKRGRYRTLRIDSATVPGCERVGEHYWEYLYQTVLVFWPPPYPRIHIGVGIYTYMPLPPGCDEDAVAQAALCVLESAFSSVSIDARLITQENTDNDQS